MVVAPFTLLTPNRAFSRAYLKPDEYNTWSAFYISIWTSSVEPQRCHQFTVDNSPESTWRSFKPQVGCTVNILKCLKKKSDNISIDVFGGFFYKISRKNVLDLNQVCLKYNRNVIFNVCVYTCFL
ncbi:hypothetical protein AMECASPLE_030761 [Ameca splendens]|uniref:Uncharacterized protein n=1 Tax=Ameca splendens TaxID=208324 RepID=A0ABV0XJ30_9TELE